MRFLSVCILLVAFFSCKKESVISEVTDLNMYKDVNFAGIFKRTSGIIAADAAVSVDLNNGKSLWLFGDSYIDNYDAQTRTVPCLFQVKNSGMLMDINKPESNPENLRYFKNAELVNKISAYYSRQGYISGLIDSDKIKQNTTLEIKSRILNNYHYKYFSSFLPTRKNDIADSLMHVLMPLENSDKDLLNEFVNSLENRRFYFTLVISETCPMIKNQAHDLILLLKKEYNI